MKRIKEIASIKPILIKAENINKEVPRFAELMGTTNKEIEYKKKGKGYNIYIDGYFIMWVIGSLKNAQKEAGEYLRNR